MATGGVPTTCCPNGIMGWSNVETTSAVRRSQRIPRPLIEACDFKLAPVVLIRFAWLRRRRDRCQAGSTTTLARATR